MLFNVKDMFQEPVSEYFWADSSQPQVEDPYVIPRAKTDDKGRVIFDEPKSQEEAFKHMVVQYVPQPQYIPQVVPQYVPVNYTINVYRTEEPTVSRYPIRSYSPVRRSVVIGCASKSQSDDNVRKSPVQCQRRPVVCRRPLQRRPVCRRPQRLYFGEAEPFQMSVYRARAQDKQDRSIEKNLGGQVDIAQVRKILFIAFVVVLLYMMFIKNDSAMKSASLPMISL